MRRYVHESVVPTSPAELFRAITNIASWPVWDPELSATEAASSLEPGSRFSLTPKGGPRVEMTISDVREPTLFADVSHLPFAKMLTMHEFIPEQSGTRVRLTIEISGPLGFLWDRVVARKQAAGAPAQTAALARYAALAEGRLLARTPFAEETAWGVLPG